MIRGAAVLVAVSLVLGAAASADGSVSKPERRAKLAVVTTSPLTLRGTQFRPRENIRLRVEIEGERYTRRTVAGRTGSFTQQFNSVAVDRCNQLIAVAIGSRGSQATVKYFEPLCPPS